MKARMAGLKLRPPQFAEVLEGMGFKSEGSLTTLEDPSADKGAIDAVAVSFSRSLN